MLKIKDEYLDYSIGGGKMNIIKMRNLNEVDYQKVYEICPYFFEDVVINDYVDETFTEEEIEYINEIIKDIEEDDID